MKCSSIIRSWRQIGLAAPQVTYLMHELKEQGLSVDTEATTVAEARASRAGIDGN